MKWLFLICLFVSFDAYARESVCPADEILAIDRLEQELNNCTITYGDNASTADMNNAGYGAVDCTIGVAHKIFDVYYSSSAKESQERFNKLVTAIYDHSHHLTHESDFAKETYTGTMYTSMAIAKAHEMIREIVKKYIKEIRFECADAHEFDN